MLEGIDLSLATRRLMDLVGEYDRLFALKKRAMDLRARYNMDRELGESELRSERSSVISSEGKKILVEVEALLEGEQEVDEPRSDKIDVFYSEDIKKKFRSRSRNFELGPINLHLKTGEITGVVGENGNGKTTLLRQVAGLLSIDSGHRSYPGLAPDHKDWYKIKQQIAWIPQRSEKWNGTLLQSLHFMAAIHGILGEENDEQVNYTIHRLGLTRFQHLTWKQLSSGYKLRFELAKMVVWRPKLLVLDEPIANLDLQAQQLFLQDLRHLAESSKYPLSIILSSQQLHEIESISDNIVFLKNGKPAFSGRVDEFGQDRNENVFEIGGDLTRIELLQALSNVGDIRIEKNGLVFNVFTPTSVGVGQLLEAISKSGLEIEYFRNISTSTRKLFHMDP